MKRLLFMVFNIVCNFLFTFLAPIFAIVALVFNSEVRFSFTKENMLIEWFQGFSGLAKNMRGSK